MRVDDKANVRSETHNIVQKVANESSIHQKIQRVSENKGKDERDSKFKPLDEKALNDIAKSANEIADIFNKILRFEVMDNPKMIVVKVENKQTGEIIRQIPPEEIVRLARNIEKLLGFLMDEKV